MPRLEDSCPYRTPIRAQRCQSCCDSSLTLPPCAMAWLQARTSHGSVALFQERQERKAA